MTNLHNDHNVFILGAGFSAPAGLPVISNFLIKMRDAREDCVDKGKTDEVRHIDEVMKFRLQASSASYRININPEDIEQLFSLASASNSETSASIRRAICSTIDYCQYQKEPYVQFTLREKEKDLLEPTNRSHHFVNSPRLFVLLIAWQGCMENTCGFFL
ncbi:hypothetical protein NC796_12455 [Aliifodinibius sp. S!AR15-10]|uniref:hypothetical protein n=1 Tax=Aliifodinibius sp. S!AR15-10 TaxID=2950437 RepID=UPI00285F8566|nr:hypothetical protein [Aliifodinibius sp. S!AR15-10]MDR8391961.1 hypothetical protein [Aliifodinibius sp. S!AR15-10]